MEPEPKRSVPGTREEMIPIIGYLFKEHVMILHLSVRDMPQTELDKKNAVDKRKKKHSGATVTGVW